MENENKIEILHGPEQFDVRNYANPEICARELAREILNILASDSPAVAELNYARESARHLTKG